MKPVETGTQVVAGKPDFPARVASASANCDQVLTNHGDSFQSEVGSWFRPSAGAWRPGTPPEFGVPLRGVSPSLTLGTEAPRQTLRRPRELRTRILLRHQLPLFTRLLDGRVSFSFGNNPIRLGLVPTPDEEMLAI